MLLITIVHIAFPQVPKINFEATSLYELADLGLADTEPPLTQSLTDDDITGLLEEPLSIELPLSTVAVERAVKDITAAARVCTDPAEQDGVTMQAIAARARHPYSDRDRRRGCGGQ